jgi:hypothetical protein
MSTSPLLNRHLLGAAGLLADERSYIAAVAEFGAFWFNWTSPAGGNQRVLGWTDSNFQMNTQELTSHPSSPIISDAGAAWKQRLAEAPLKRMFVKASSFEDTSPELGAIVQLLNHPAAGLESVLVQRDAPLADIRWQWPLRVAALPADLVGDSLESLRSDWPSKNLTEIQTITRDSDRCEILIVLVPLRDGLRAILRLPHHIRAGHIIVLGPVDLPWREVQSRVDTLLAETQAAALSLVSLDGSRPISELLNRLVEEISHNTPYDLALARAFPRESSVHFSDLRLIDQAALPTVAKGIGQRLKRLPPGASFDLPPDTTHRINMHYPAPPPPAELGIALERDAANLPFGHESTGGMGLSEIANAEKKARRNAAIDEQPRSLQGDLAKFSEGSWTPETTGLIVGGSYRLDVFIAPPGTGAIPSTEAIPEGEFDWSKSESYNLKLLFTEPRQFDKPFEGTIKLSRYGTSSKCSFLFSPTQPGPFSGRVIVYYRGRVLQTALLQMVVVAEASALASLENPLPLRLAVEAEVRRSLSTLDDRRRFDACVVLNHNTDGSPGMTAAGDQGAYIASLNGLATQLATINSLLNDVALNTKKYSKGLLSKENAQLLCALAAEGNVLYRSLVIDYIDRSSAASILRNAEYLQIVSAEPDAIVPLEFVYEYPPPADGAPVCKNAIQALKDGRCPEACVPKVSPAPCVCPLGFWGLKKVIERHKHNALTLQAAEIRTRLAEPLVGRDVLSLAGPSLLAASQEVPAEDCRTLEQAMAKAWKGGVSVVHMWPEWQATVQSTNPVLLLALPHAAGTGSGISLEIDGDTIQGIFINDSYVHVDKAVPAPIVLLLGCDTVNVAIKDAYARHIEIFRQADAALVLGTVATVLGADAAKVAALLVERLGSVATASSQRFGEVLRQVKREAVANSQMMALCLAAFGDADWKLK